LKTGNYIMALLKKAQEGGGTPSNLPNYLPSQEDFDNSGILLKTYDVTPLNGDRRLRENVDKIIWEKFYDPLGATAYAWHQVSDIEIPDVTTSNDVHFIYLRGDADTEDSVRFMLDNGTTKIQKLVDSIWVDASFTSGSATINFSNDVSVGSVGHHLNISSKSTGEKYFAIQIPFNDDGTKDVGTPKLGTKIFRSIIQPDESGEWIGTTLRYDRPITSQFIYDKLYFKVGSVIATKHIRIRLYRNIEDRDHLFYDETFNYSTFSPANAEISINVKQDVSYIKGINIIAVYESEEPFSFKTNVDGTIPWIAMDQWLEHHEYIPSWDTWEEKTWNTNEAIVKNGILYICQESGSQTGTFDSNISAGKWKSLEDVLSGIGESSSDDSKDLVVNYGVSGGAITDVYSSDSSSLNGGLLSEDNSEFYIINGGTLDNDFNFQLDGGTF